MVKRTKRTPVRECCSINIVQLRLKLGLSQLDLAKKSGVKRLSIACYEGGYHEPSMQALVQLAVGLECEISDIVTFDRARVRAILMPLEPRVDQAATAAVEFPAVSPAPVASGAESTGGPEGSVL